MVIAGGGDSAVDWALSLAEVAAHVAVVHRRDKFRAAPESVRQLHALAEGGGSELVIPYQLHAWKARRDELRPSSSAIWTATSGGWTPTCCCRSSGCRRIWDLIADWGLDLDRHHGRGRSGHLRRRPGRHLRHRRHRHLSRQAEADPDAASPKRRSAAHAIFPRVHPGEALHFEYSTTKGVPGRT